MSTANTMSTLNNTSDEIPKLTELTEEELAKLNQQKSFWPESELSYLLGDEVSTPTEHISYILSLNLSQIERIRTGQDQEGEDKFQEFVLYHPGWSTTAYNMTIDMGDEEPIPIAVIDFNDNSAETGIETTVNELGNGACPITISLYCHFFQHFDFAKKDNQELLYRVYTCESTDGYKFEDSDYSNEDFNAFILYLEKDRDTYHNAQLMQSLLLFADFMNCKLLVDFCSSRMAHYINLKINEFCKLKDEPETLKKLLKPGTDTTFIKDIDDLIVNLMRQFLGEPHQWQSYEEYDAFKTKIGWIRDEKQDLDWTSMESEAKKSKLS